MNNLETQALHLIGENVDSPDVFTDDDSGMAQIRESLNDAIEEISLLTGCTKGTFHVVLQANRGFYRLRFTKDEIAWITDVWLVGQKRRLEQTDLIRLNAFNRRWMQNDGNPYSYYPIGFNVVGFWPIPSASDIVQIDGVVIPDRYTSDTARIRLRKEFEKAAVNLAVSEYWASRGDAKTATTYLMRYTDSLGLLTQYQMAAERQWTRQTGKEPWPKVTE
jgi:hypothetical protein